MAFWFYVDQSHNLKRLRITVAGEIISIDKVNNLKVKKKKNNKCKHQVHRFFLILFDITTFVFFDDQEDPSTERLLSSQLFAIWQKLSFIQRVIAADTQYHLSLSLFIHKHTQMKERERERVKMGNYRGNIRHPNHTRTYAWVRKKGERGTPPPSPLPSTAILFYFSNLPFHFNLYLFLLWICFVVTKRISLARLLSLSLSLYLLKSLQPKTHFPMA